MKLPRLGLLIFLLAFLPVSAHAGWNMVFDDEFNGDSLNRDAWFTRYIYGDDTTDHLTDEKEVYRDNNNHIVKDGHLELTARPNGQGGYDSGMIRSKQTFYYGYYEARVKFPSGKGVFPAFWFGSDLDADGHASWPPEIDVFEFVNNVQNDNVKMVHSSNGDKDAPYTDVDPHFNLHWRSYVSDTDMTTDYHVWGLMWVPDTVTIYLDGTKLYSVPYHWVGKGAGLAPPAHILLNLAIGGAWAGRFGIDDSAFPQALDVDYVRVYQFDPNKQGSVTSLPNVPDFASYHYNAPGDMARPVVYPAEQLPPSVKPGDLLHVIYHVDSIPIKHHAVLRLDLVNAAGKSIAEQAFDLPHDTRAAAETIKARASLAIPAMTGAGDYDLRLALAYCPTDDCKPAAYTNIPLTTAAGAVRGASAWYRIGTVKVEE